MRHWMLALCTAILVLFWWQAADAVNPTITGTSDPELEHGVAITLTGTDFGTKATAAPLQWDDFEGGVVDDDIPPNNNWNAWYLSEGLRYPTYTNINPRSAVAQQSSYGDLSYGSNKLLRYVTACPELYVSYWVRHHITVLGSPGNFKELKLEGNGGDWRTGVPPYDPDPYCHVPDVSPQTNLPPPTTLYNRIQAAPYGTIEYYGINDWSFNWPVTNDQWRRRELWVRVTDALGQALKAWNDATQNRDWPTPADWAGGVGPHMGDYNSRFVAVHFPFYIRDGSEGYLQYDEVYIDTTQARVEIGNAATWEQCTHREIQIPSAWSSTSITITVNQGSFQSGSKAYLYVVDVDGKVNADGFPIIFRKSEVPVAGAPGKPLPEGAVASSLR